MPVSYEQPSQTPTPPTGDGPDHPTNERGGGGWPLSRPLTLMVGSALVLLVATIILGLTHRNDDDAKRKAPESSKGPASSGAVLPRGTVTFGEGGSEDLFGMPIKYPHTIDGGAAAAINESAASSSPLTANEAAREALNNYIYTADAAKKFAVTLAEADKERQKAGLDENGQVVNDDGTVDSSATYLSSTVVPEYGVYRIMPGATTERVTVQWWAPIVDGIARPDSQDLTVTWNTVEMTVVWDRGDWRIDAGGAPKYAPDPASKSTLNVSFAERAALFPAKDGWVMVRNATQSTSAFPDGVAK